MLGVARLKSGASREFALNTVRDAGMARRKGDSALAGHILATGLVTFFPTRVASAGDDTTSKPDAMHAGWQANLGRGVTALIARVDDQLHKVQFDANADVVHGHPSRDALLDAVRGDGGITAGYRHTITKAALLNNDGRHDEALVVLRAAPMHLAIMNYFAVPSGAPGSDVAERALSKAHETLYAFQNLVNGDGATPSGFLGQQVSYAQEHPDVLRTRGLVQSAGAELLRIGAYGDALDTVRPPVPPRVDARSAPQI